MLRIYENTLASKPTVKAIEAEYEEAKHVVQLQADRLVPATCTIVPAANQ